MLRPIGQARFPQDVAGCREGSRAVGAEVDIDRVAFHDWRRRCVAVLGVLKAGVGDAKDLAVHHLGARLDVEGERS